MKTNRGMDTGDMLISDEFVIEPHMTAGDVFEGLTSVVCGGYKNDKYENKGLLSRALKLIESGDYTLTKQNKEEATYARMLKKQDGLIDWSRPAKEIVNLIRGCNPWPMAYTYINGKKLTVVKVSSCTGCNAEIKEKINNAKAGEIVIANPKISLQQG